ncbi:hypothetical protein CIL03_00625 [Virgibacillus indicus]|uniref:DUF4367 domain-containing protein n=1 Tax=Virgibacillus indicus TaxID=2024554 RepID=A0A265NCC3_9BACI|nr:hypothetical protein [Virgibacillus indicus]OZU89678.1 hypothetical protein CIL03_00625 [Virgibacillus indicus]
MKNPIQLIIAVLILTAALSACSMKSEEDAIADALAITEDTFKSETAAEANFEHYGESFYLPDKLEVESKDKSNLVLTDGDQTYIIFYNKNEGALSELNFNAVQNSNALLLESFNDGEKFGYVSVLPDEGEGYQLQIGIGGAKITTYTDKGKMDDDAKELMKIAKSIAAEATEES